MKQILLFIFIVTSLLLHSCNQKTSNNSASSKAMEDFLKQQMTLPDINKQTFTISTNDTTIVEGKNGTIVLFRKDCFVDGEGNPVNHDIKLELVEALTMEDMLLAGLSTKDEKGKILRSGGMLYLQAYHEGEKLNIDPNKAPYVEIPTNNKVNGMMVYEASIDSKGGFQWVSPRQLENFLINVGFESLNFRPKGFDEELVKNLPYKKHTSFSEEFADSLYYSFRLYSFHSADDTREEDYDMRGINPLTIKAIRQKSSIRRSSLQENLQNGYKQFFQHAKEVFWKSIFLISTRISGYLIHLLLQN